ncbi:hypothetical protein ACIBAH_32660 [Streptomyces sp. NPDC051445]|uniref:hypothetical protein n=1 Tax=Streptomyces sp. NPDC051445 TaxID=3365653 RepID=UPI0037876F69
MSANSYSCPSTDIGTAPTDTAYDNKLRTAASTPFTRRSPRTGFVLGPHATVDAVPSRPGE